MTDYEKILLTLDNIDVKLEEMVEIVEALKGSISQIHPYEDERDQWLKAARQRNEKLLAVVGDK